MSFGSSDTNRNVTGIDSGPAGGDPGSPTLSRTAQLA